MEERERERVDEGRYGNGVGQDAARMRMSIARRTLADGRAGWSLVCPSSSSSKKKRRGGSWCWGTLGRSPVRPSDLRVGGLPRHPKNVVQLLVPHGEPPFRTLTLSLALAARVAPNSLSSFRVRFPKPDLEFEDQHAATAFVWLASQRCSRRPWRARRRGW